jgi:hypothetical protein
MSFGRRNVPVKALPPRRAFSSLPKDNTEAIEYRRLVVLAAVFAGVLVTGLAALTFMARSGSHADTTTSTEAIVSKALEFTTYEYARRQAESQRELLQMEINRRCDETYTNPTDRHFCKVVD